MTNWDAFVKTYDVRGLVGEQLDDSVIEALGAGFVDELGLEGKSLVVGYDMRDSSEGFAAAFARGANARGATVIDIGLCSTDMTYFASGSWQLPAVMFTASHNPATYNGLKFSRAGARGISLNTGLAAIRDRAIEFYDSGIPKLEVTGIVEQRSVVTEYVNHLRNLVNLEGIRPLRIVVDAANGMGGMTVPAVMGSQAGHEALPIEVIPMFFELDGSFPNHEANPLDPKNLVDLQRAVILHGADLGLAFDGDADRCFVIDERGEAVTPSAVAAIVSKREILRAMASNPSEKVAVIHNLLTSRHVPELIESLGATPVRTRVGHSLIKDEMAASGAIFGGEHSAHYYFKEFWGADNGMLAALHVVAELAASGLLMSELAAKHSPYFASGEINSTVEDAAQAQARVADLFAAEQSERFDGVTYSGIDAQTGAWWWANVRSSNTEPLLRLNVEAERVELMEQIRDKALAAIRN